MASKKICLAEVNNHCSLFSHKSIHIVLPPIEGYGKRVLKIKNHVIEMKDIELILKFDNIFYLYCQASN